MANDNKTNDSKTNQAKVEVNGDAQALEPSLQQEITAALAHNGGLKRVEAKLRQGFDETGFSQTVKEYATHLLRSGEVTTFPELEAKVWQHINANSKGKTVDDSTAIVTAPNLAVPQLGLDDGAAQIRKELAEILVTKKTPNDGVNTPASNADASVGSGLVDNAKNDVTTRDAPHIDFADADTAGTDTTNGDDASDQKNNRGAPQSDIADRKTSAESAPNHYKAASKTTEDKFKVIQMEAQNSPTSQRQSRSKRRDTTKGLS